MTEEINELKKLRRYHGLTYKDMADMINVDPRTYRNKELGITQFKATEMFIIAKRFGKTIEDIFLPSNFMKHEVLRGEGELNATHLS